MCGRLYERQLMDPEVEKDSRRTVVIVAAISNSGGRRKDWEMCTSFLLPFPSQQPVHTEARVDM